MSKKKPNKSGGDVEQPMKGLDVYIRLLKYLKNLKFPFFISIVGFALFAASQPVLAKLMEMIIGAIESQDSSARWTLPMYAMGIFALRGLGHFLGTYYNGFVGATLIRNVKAEAFSHLSVLPATFFDQQVQGKILHKINNGVSMIESAVTGALKTVIREGLTVIFLLSYVFYLNWQLSLTFIAVAPLVALLVGYTTRRLKKISRKSENALGTAMQVTKEMVSNFNVVRGFGAENYERQRYGNAINDAFDKQMKIRQLEAIATPVMQFVIAMAVAGIVFLLLQPDTLRENTAGQLIGYLTAVALIPKSLRQLSGVNMAIQRGIVGGEMVFQILDAPAEEDNGTVVKDTVEGLIEIKNIDFKYVASNDWVLKDFSITINPGETVALVGKSGSGKSTLTSLITRLYNAQNGEIMLDGTRIQDYKLANLRQQISIVSQHVTLFDDTIRNNIGYGDTKYSDEQIIEAAKKAHAWEFIETQEKGLDTPVGDNGLKLSGGQRQRIAIARAFLKDAPILILDEATSALDNESERIIKDAVETIMQNRTTIVIAHRLSTIQKADRLIVLVDGQISEQGTHEELIEQGGVYHDLCRAEYT